MDRFLIGLLMFGAVGVLCLVILVTGGFAAFLFAGEYRDLLNLIPDNPTGEHRILVSLLGIATATVTALVTTAIGLFAAYRTYRNTAAANARAQRKQHTINILFQSRLSEYFQTTNSLRKEIFPTDQDIYLDDWKAARAQNGKPREGAEALQQLLNYYEFLAVGIEQGDLDKDLLRKSIRGIMCNLVDDARFMIAELRENDPTTLEHLAQLYEEWRAEKLNYAGVLSERAIPSSAEVAAALLLRREGR
ncbi:DUF4760 domain-containing protein [Epibacterium sp. SM1969]|uniref:DUF4760 domain-containing protein n=1 Tax=Tritonibacter aquimaris TaxID=2663379 RepID=A0A844AM74_9RHOB|nr:DUF4760 domain-containing protein [Tritonibacter aquimaris]MQY43009.1 DUF4760 domain-containing protein [Tritonibacter aquimaris]